MIFQYIPFTLDLNFPRFSPSSVKIHWIRVCCSSILGLPRFSALGLSVRVNRNSLGRGELVVGADHLLDGHFSSRWIMSFSASTVMFWQSLRNYTVLEFWMHSNGLDITYAIYKGCMVMHHFFAQSLNGSLWIQSFRSSWYFFCRGSVGSCIFTSKCTLSIAISQLYGVITDENQDFIRVQGA